MTQCIINVVENSVFLAFSEIVKKGIVEVWKTNGTDEAVCKKEISNTNFEYLQTPLGKGKYRFDISIDGQQITKTININ